MIVEDTKPYMRVVMTVSLTRFLLLGVSIICSLLPLHSLTALHCQISIHCKIQARFILDLHPPRPSQIHPTRLHFTATMPKEAKTKRASKPRVEKKKKDPNAPKRGLSAYMFFANEQRENVREENPGISFGQVGKVLGERWKALNDKQRTPYEAKAAQDKKRYEDEKASYNEESG